MKRRTFLQSCAAMSAVLPLGRHATASPATKKTCRLIRRARLWHVPINAPCSRYAKIQPVEKCQGFYLSLTPEEIALRKSVYDQGRKPRKRQTETFRWEEFKAKRYDGTPFDLARNRSLRAADTLINTPCWNESNTVRHLVTIDRETVELAAQNIQRNTLGLLAGDELKSRLVIVMNPTTAVGHGAVIPGGSLGHPDCKIPSHLHGIPLVVEDAISNERYVIPHGVALMLIGPQAKPEPTVKSPDFTALTLFMLEDGTAWMENGRTRVVDDFDCKVTSPASAVFIRPV